MDMSLLRDVTTEEVEKITMGHRWKCYLQNEM